MQYDTVLVLDFGGQYNQMIARRARECGVYSVVRPYTVPIAEIAAAGYKGILLTGGQRNVNEPDAPQADPALFSLGIPVLGIGYGAQLMAHALGGRVGETAVVENGQADLTIDDAQCPLFAGIAPQTPVWTRRACPIQAVPEGFAPIAHTADDAIAGMQDANRKLYALSFHPEATQTVDGAAMLRHFLRDVCGCADTWTMECFVEESIAVLRERLAGKKVLCALSGGVDSSVTAVLIHKAVGKNLTCVFVDHGLLRKGEAEQVETVFRKQYDIDLICVDASDRFLDKLAGVREPERKRKIIGEEFIRVFEEEARKLGKIDCFAQGTIYPDVIESGVGEAGVLKSHHNVGGLPEHIDFDELVEPLRDLFKNEVRAVGEALGIPHHLVWRQPFPGPGLGIRVIGDITREKLAILKDADALFREAIAESGCDRDADQYFAVLTDMRSVGMTGETRSYDYTLALRAVTTNDFMTAEWTRLPYDLLDAVSRRIVQEVPHINRIVYDITSKPPATIEWE